MSKKLMLAAVLAGALAGAANLDKATAGSGPDVSHFTLSNGLEVVVVPDHRAPVVTHMIWYKVGAADETAGKSGLAHFLEHLMFKGTEKIRAPRSRRTSTKSAARRTRSPRAIIPVSSSACRANISRR